MKGTFSCISYNTRLVQGHTHRTSISWARFSNFVHLLDGYLNRVIDTVSFFPLRQSRLRLIRPLFILPRVVKEKHLFPTAIDAHIKTETALCLIFIHHPRIIQISPCLSFPVLSFSYRIFYNSKNIHLLSSITYQKKGLHRYIHKYYGTK